ncbi:MAG: SUMF1/EgtB/PvdO family nonheme iron enzyme [Deltaproteobacteria bacterium]|nr:SUMF1/EgtB/PvdO family nonheme iron enzyme [Deltaproteobacteria bacterium]
MAYIPGGTFVRGVDGDAPRCTQHGQPADLKSAAVPARTVHVDSFLLDRHEVSNQAYASCADAGQCRPAGALYPGFREPTQPVTGVSWHDALRFCQVQGKRLPTEAEWEKATRGPDGESHPWGDAPASCERAIVRNSAGRGCGQRVPGVSGDVGRIAEVGSRPAGRYGLYDMVGNAGEWVADWWTASYRVCGADCGGANPRGPCAGAYPCPGHGFKVVRGGSWYWSADHATGFHRRRHTPSNAPFHHFGFRCAADVSAQAAAPPAK